MQTLEEAAASLGANRWQTFRRVMLPAIFPAALTGFAMAFARARRRIRLGGIHLRQHADANRDHAAVDHHQAGTVRLRRRDGDRGGHAGGFIRVAAGHQCVAEVERQRLRAGHSSGAKAPDVLAHPGVLPQEA